MDYDKQQRLMELISEIQEMYPELDSFLVDNIDEPTQITITTETNVMEIAESLGLDVVSEEDEEFDNIKLIEYYEDDDDEGGGFFH